MTNLEDLVGKIVSDFVSSGTLFTALDVSNEVKKAMPWARHREVRDAVRVQFPDMELNGYSKTPVTVNLPDGTTAQALLYHSLSDSWDLDSKYDAQKRSQSVVKPTTTQVVQAAACNANPVANNAATVVCTAPAQLTVAPNVSNDKNADQSTNSGKNNSTWDQLFKHQPSLFPRKMI